MCELSEGLCGTGFGQTGQKQGLGATSWPLALNDLSYFIEHVNTTLPLFLIGHSMGGALALAFATRNPAQPGLDKIKGIVSASPLILQAKGAVAPALMIRLVDSL